MVQKGSLINVTKRFPTAEVLISLGLFLLALLPRAYDLQRFVTADEAKWVYRSAQFLAAFLNGDYAATTVNLTPAVTTTWLGGLALAIYYNLNQATLEMPFTEWLLSLPEFRTELPILVAARWVMVIFTSLSVVVIYWLARRLFNSWLAYLGTAFIALDAHTVALSRILGHDAPVAMFTVISLLLFLIAIQTVEDSSRSRLIFVAFSGITAALAFLSKAPAFFLIPFIFTILGTMALKQVVSWPQTTTLFALWGVAAFLTFTLIWPAAWLDPIGRPWAVVENAFLSATDHVEANAEGFWLVPNLGPFYYLVNGAFKLNPLVFIGVGLAAISAIISNRESDPAFDQPSTVTHHASRITQILFQKSTSSPLLWLTLFTLLFTIFMTLGGKRSPRYILPIFPALAFVAAYGWLQLLTTISKLRITHHASRILLATCLTIVAVFTLIPYSPYYFTYFNPLLGGSYTAPNLVKIGWGEGLDQVGRFLQRELPNSRVGTAYASTVAPYFKGDLSAVTGDRLDYVVLYIKQAKSGNPSPSFVRYFEHIDPIFSVALDGIHYADVYPGPAPQPAITFTDDGENSAPQPISFRSHVPYGKIGQPLQIDIIWQAADPLPTEPVTLALKDHLERSDTENSAVDTIRYDQRDEVWAEGEGVLTRLADELVISEHRLVLPETLERGKYSLLVDGQLLGDIELRHFDVPAKMGGVRGVVFDEQIGIVGYTFHPTEDYISVTIAWQAEQTRLPDYTVFAQFIDASNGERMAGIDTQPVKGEWPTSRWAKGEIVIDEYFVAMPPGLEPGYYGMMVGLYQPETGQRLVRANGQDFWPLPFTFIRE